MDELTRTRLWNLVLRYLSYRARSEKEIRNYLERKLWRSELPTVEREKLIAKILARLKELNFLNDAVLTEAVVAEGRRRLKGRRRIYLDLKKKGLKISSLSPLSNSSSPSEEDLARAAAEKRARFYQGLDPPTFRRRLAGYLVRRGFEWEVIKPVIDSFSPKS